MFDDDPLHVLDLKDWKNFRRELENDWPKGVILYQFIETRLQWELKEPNKHPFYVCCPEGIIRNGLVAFGKVNGLMAYASVYTFDRNVDKLKYAILNSKRIEWEGKPTWGIPEEDYTWFADILNSKGYKSHDSFPTPYYLLLNKQKIESEIQCPDDVYLSLLKDEDLATVNSIWPHNYEGSEDYLKDIRRLNYGYGVYSKCNDELLSWALKYEYGDIGVLQTKQEHKRKGYAEIVVRAMSKNMLEDGENVHVHIIKGNVASEKLFLNLGFEVVGNVRWIEY